MDLVYKFHKTWFSEIKNMLFFYQMLKPASAISKLLK